MPQFCLGINLKQFVIFDSMILISWENTFKVNIEITTTTFILIYYGILKYLVIDRKIYGIIIHECFKNTKLISSSVKKILL